MLVRLSEILETAIKLTEADCGNIQYLDSDGSLKIILERGFSDSWVAYWENINFGSTSSCEKALGKSRILVPSVRNCLSTPCTERVHSFQNKPMFSNKGNLLAVLNTPNGLPFDFETSHSFTVDQVSMESFLWDNIQGFHCTPILSKKGNLLGVISIHYKRPFEFVPKHFLAINALVAHIADLIEFNKEIRSCQKNDNEAYIQYLENKIVKSQDTNKIIRVNF